MPTQTSDSTSTAVTVPLRIRINRGLRPLHLARARGPEALRDAIHGVLLYLAVLGSTYRADYPPGKTLLLCFGSVVVFWIAHVYSATLARHGSADGSTGAVAFGWQEARRSTTILQAVAAPSIALLLALAGILPLAVAAVVSLWIGIGSLVGLSYLAVRVRQSSRLRAAGVGAITGALGGAIILGSSYVH